MLDTRLIWMTIIMAVLTIFVSFIVAIRRRLMLTVIKNILHSNTQMIKEFITNDDNNDDDQNKCLERIRNTLVEVRIRKMMIEYLRRKLIEIRKRESHMITTSAPAVVANSATSVVSTEK
ncbi:hypothetical protein DERF_006334 [Dermatophagoides farinae]|uniref:Uncharacterized protein n=2 Tax=Dermatophagoides farinae TaxID=6954 RepID=A0A922L7L1_DERFA|nr:hypothetical protein DERF_006334 [Dermatophagoides farinae]